jgi:hypothetical protein
MVVSEEKLAEVVGSNPTTRSIFTLYDNDDVLTYDYYLLNNKRQQRQ